jgi:cell wall-associated protease
MQICKSWWASASFVLLAGTTAVAQEKAPENWFNLDYNSGKVHGLGTEKAYNETLKGKTAQKVIVAVLDSGVEIDHPDLVGRIWVNTKEIAGNGIDDDKNGYVDDVNGWNFIGGAGGKNIDHETLEVTRLYKELKPKYDGKKAEDMKGKKDKAEFAQWLEVKEAFEKEYDKAKKSVDGLTARVKGLPDMVAKAQKQLGVEKLTAEAVSKISDEDKELGGRNKMLLLAIAESSLEDVMEQMKGGIEHYQNSLDYNLNVNLDARKKIVGDDDNDYTNRSYGNNDVEGPDASHGTHVSGIIAANRNNNEGIKGVCNDCVIMSVRCVPDGDERDKDVANAIRYAVDNGAQVLNMSFGKAFPKNKAYVDEALKYAEKKGVLLVHAAGNEHTNKDEKMNYPNRYYKENRKKAAKNWLDIGAMTWLPGEDLVADFSNYGKETVDVFAPGYGVYSTIPDGKYASFNGTSMAAPTVAGAAGLLLSYFPTLSAEQIKDIIMASAAKNTTEVIIPGEKTKKAGFDQLSITGGIIDVVAAIKLAEKTKGKRKMAKKP